MPRLDPNVFRRRVELALDRLRPALLQDGGNLELIDVRGVRVVTPFAQIHDLPLVGSLLGQIERLSADAPLLRQLGGFLIVILRKRGG